MSDPQKKQKLFYNRAQHQLREIEFSCREVVTLSQNIKMMGGEISDTDINCKKIEFIKTQIKEKLKEVASNIDQIYKILDRKIVILTKELRNQLKCQSNAALSNNDSVNSSLNKINVAQKNTQKTNTASHQSSLEQDRFFSETLNPRVAQLQTKLVQCGRRESLLNSKVAELKSKNQKLIEQFNRLSTASNKKINQLSSEINNLTSRDRDSFGSLENSGHSRRKEGEKYKPFLTFDLQAQPPARSPKKNKEKSYPEPQQQYFNTNDDSMANEKNRPFTFGCMPSNKPQKDQNRGSLNYQKIPSQDCSNLNKEDRNRRFDILLNQLRYTDQSEAKSQQQLPLATKKSVEGEITSVFSKEVVRRYQI